MSEKEAACALCGMLGKPAEYHPLAYCLLAKELGSKAARASINEVLNHGRALERSGLPNDAWISDPRLRKPPSTKGKTR